MKKLFALVIPVVKPNPNQPEKQFAFGQHALGKLVACSPNTLADLSSFQLFIEKEINRLQLNPLGNVYHQFPQGGFTAVVCLAESHLSVHTWPEYNFVTFDVFLSNYQRNNEDKTHQLKEALHAFFGGTLTDYSFIYR
ncbi:MAG: adenosylmethionine decarboxylase [Chryseotalea sp.]